MPTLGLGLSLKSVVRPGNAGILDLFGGAAAAYSFRNLTREWASSAVARVRRSSDNSELDVTASDITDGTLIAFCGAGDGFVVTWYDQSGNANDATQSTAANQPQIVSSGSLVSGGMSFDGVAQLLDVATAGDLGISGATSRTFISVMNTPAATDGFIVFGGSNATTGTALRYRSSNINGNSRVEIQGDGIESFDISDGNQHIFSSTFAGSTIADFDIFVDGSVTNGTGTTTVNTESTMALTVGFVGLSTNAGFINELILYPTDEASNLTSIHQNIASYYGIAIS